MKQNKYDDSAFFASYSKMPRSIRGLEAAGEWEILKRMLPGLKGKSVLDLGCGYGWHCIYAKEQGATKIVGIDISEKMLEKARANSKSSLIEYKQMAIEDIDFGFAEFDVVISSLALHYIQDFALICDKISRLLKHGGHFVFSIEHPLFTATDKQDWIVDETGNRLHWPVDNYQIQGVRHTNFLGHEVTKYHRTLETTINSLIDSGFMISRISEPYPSQDILKKYPEMKDEFRRPIFLLLSAIKTSGI